MRYAHGFHEVRVRQEIGARNTCAVRIVTIVARILPAATPVEDYLVGVLLRQGWHVVGDLLSHVHHSFARR